MTKPKIIYNPATIAECGGPCEQGPEYCDCGTLRINCPDASMDDHPLTDEMCDQIVSSTPPLPRDHQDRVLSYDGRILDGMFEECFEEQKHEMRAAYDKGGKDRLELIITWLDDELHCYLYSSDGEAEINYDSLFKDLREAMRPEQQQEDNND